MINWGEISPMSQVFIKVKVPWGVFGLDGCWHPNPLLKISEDEQFCQNVENGFIKIEKRKVKNVKEQQTEK